jgi:hypothetical protein
LSCVRPPLWTSFMCIMGNCCWVDICIIHALTVWGIISCAIECSQTKDIQVKPRGHKLRSAVYWQVAFKLKDVKQGLCHGSQTHSPPARIMWPMTTFVGCHIFTIKITRQFRQLGLPLTAVCLRAARQPSYKTQYGPLPLRGRRPLVYICIVFCIHSNVCKGMCGLRFWSRNLLSEWIKYPFTLLCGRAK